MSEKNVQERREAIDAGLAHEAKRKCEVQVVLKGTIDVGCPAAADECGKITLAKIAANVLMSQYMRRYARDAQIRHIFPIDFDATVYVLDDDQNPLVEIKLQDALNASEDPPATLSVHVDYLDENGFSIADGVYVAQPQPVA